MEAKLAEFRARKKNENKIGTNGLLQRIFPNDKDSTKEQDQKSINDNSVSSENKNASTNLQEEQPSIQNCEAQYGNVSYRSTKLLTFANILKFLLWLILWGLFIELEFGSVYAMMSLFCFVYLNTRTGSKKPDEPSAYSVFNPNCERIDGSLTAEQFEQEIKYGAGGVGKR